MTGPVWSDPEGSGALGGDTVVECFLFVIIVGVFGLIIVAELTYHVDDDD